MVGAKTLLACGAGPVGDAETFPEVYSVWRPYAKAVRLTTIPAGSWKAFTTGKSSSNRSTMASMIGSGKVRMVDAVAGSQCGRPSNNTRPRCSPERAFSYPFLPMARGVPVMRNRRGMPCLQPGTPAPGCRCWGSWIYAQVLFHGGDGDEMCDAPETTHGSVSSGRRQRPQRPPPT